MEANGMSQRVLTLEEEMRIQRERSHTYGNKLTEQGSHIEDARDDIKNLREEMNTRFKDQNEKLDKRFDAVGALFWKASGLIIGAMAVAVALLK